MYQSNPISLSSILLSYLTVISDCTVCTNFFLLLLLLLLLLQSRFLLLLITLFCQETALRGWSLTICLRMCWRNWSIQSAWSTCYHPSRYVAIDTFAAGGRRKFRNVQPADNHFSKHLIRHWKNWLYELSVLAPINHTDAHSLFRSLSYVIMKV